jgi:hypothetical protein
MQGPGAQVGQATQAGMAAAAPYAQQGQVPPPAQYAGGQQQFAQAPPQQQFQQGPPQQQQFQQGPPQQFPQGPPVPAAPASLDPSEQQILATLVAQGQPQQ